MKFNKRLKDIEQYKPSQRYYDNIEIKLDWNESVVFPSKKSLKEINQSFKNIKLNEYPDVTALSLKTDLEKYLNINKDCIEVFNGSDDALNTIFETLLDENKKILYFSPTYNQIKTLIGSKTNNVFIRDIVDPIRTHLYNFDELNDYDVVYIVNPNNPTGHLIDTNTIEKLLIDFPSTMFIIDEAYSEFSNISCKELINSYKNIIITRTFSKAFGLAALRIGYLLTSTENIHNIIKIRNGKNVNSIAQKAASICLKNISDFQKHIKKTNNTRNRFIKFLNKTKHFKCFPSNSNFVIIHTKYNKNLLDVLKNNGILIRDFSNVKNLDNCIRITIGSNNQMKYIMKVIKEMENE